MVDYTLRKRKILPLPRYDFCFKRIFVDNYRSLWYNKNKEALKYNSLLVLLSLKEEQEIKNYRNFSNNIEVKEVVEKTEKLKGSEGLSMQWDYELDAKLLHNTEIYCAREEGEKNGEKVGKLKEKISIANKMFKSNIDKSTIIACTKISEKEYEKIVEENKKNMKH